MKNEKVKMEFTHFVQCLNACGGFHFSFFIFSFYFLLFTFFFPQYWVAARGKIRIAGYYVDKSPDTYYTI
jgi:hypothetical protein